MDKLNHPTYKWICDGEVNRIDTILVQATDHEQGRMITLRGYVSTAEAGEYQRDRMARWSQQQLTVSYMGVEHGRSTMTRLSNPVLRLGPGDRPESLQLELTALFHCDNNWSGLFTPPPSIT